VISIRDTRNGETGLNVPPGDVVPVVVVRNVFPFRKTPNFHFHANILAQTTRQFPALHLRRSTRRHVLPTGLARGLPGEGEGEVGVSKNYWKCVVVGVVDAVGLPCPRVKFRACFTFACESSRGSCATLSRTFYADCRIVVACRVVFARPLFFYSALDFRTSELASPSLRANASDSSEREKFPFLSLFIPFLLLSSWFFRSEPTRFGRRWDGEGREAKWRNEARADGGMKRRCAENIDHAIARY